MKVEYNQILQYIDKKDYPPVVVLDGKESFYVDKVAKKIQTTFFDDVSMQDFDFQLLYGKETSVKDLVASAKQFPMMASKRLVLLREAQHVVGIDKLTEYVKHPQQQTVLVLAFMEGKTLDGRSPLYKEILKSGLLFRSDEVYENKLPPHVDSLAKEKGFVIYGNEINLLIAHVGNDLSRINNELDKLTAVANENEVVTGQMIEQYIGVNRQYNSFELAAALLARNKKKVFEITDFFKNNSDKLKSPDVIAAIFNAFYKLLRLKYATGKDGATMKSLGIFWADERVYLNALSYFSMAKLITIIRILRRYDLISKGGEGQNMDDATLVQELAIRIITV